MAEFNVMTSIAQLIIAVASAVITFVLVPFIRSKFSDEQLKEALAWIERSVKAAEQRYPDADSGKKKMAYVKEKLNVQAMPIKSETVELLIEAAVYDLNNEKQEDVYVAEADITDQ